MPTTSLDQAWADINALGGPGRPSDPYDLGYAEALDAALEAVERHGGARPERHDTHIKPLPNGIRALLLRVLKLGYPGDYAQNRLSNAPDSVIAWQVQSLLDDYASATLARKHANDNFDDSPDPDDARFDYRGWRGLAA